MKAVTLALLAFACVSRQTIRQALERFPVARPETSVSVQDTIVALSLREAVLHGIPDFTPSPHVVVQAIPGLVSSRTLPAIDSVSFFLLDSVQIRQLATRAGNFFYLRPSAPQIRGDTATIGLKGMLGFRRTNRGVGTREESACAWRAVRRSGTWAVDTTLGCIIW